VRHLLPLATARRVLQVHEPWREGAAVVFDRPQANQMVLEKIDGRTPRAAATTSATASSWANPTRWKPA